MSKKNDYRWIVEYFSLNKPEGYFLILINIHLLMELFANSMLKSHPYLSNTLLLVAKVVVFFFSLFSFFCYCINVCKEGKNNTNKVKLWSAIVIVLFYGIPLLYSAQGLKKFIISDPTLAYILLILILGLLLTSTFIGIFEHIKKKYNQHN